MFSGLSSTTFWSSREARRVVMRLPQSFPTEVSMSVSKFSRHMSFAENCKALEEGRSLLIRSSLREKQLKEARVISILTMIANLAKTKQDLKKMTIGLLWAII